MKFWLKAFRLRTLPLALSGIILGSALGGFANWPVSVMLILTATLLQITSNLANDYGDFKKGSDNNRQGEARMVSSGKISAGTMLKAVYLFAVLGLICGISAVIISPASLYTKLAVFATGLFAIWAAIAYTMGKMPYGYQGLGDLFVLIFFGWVPVLVSKLLLGGELAFLDIFPSTALGLLATSVLNVNNLRDAEEDKKNGKKTVVVRLGIAGAKSYHAMLIALHFLFLSIYNIQSSQQTLLSILPYLSLVLIIPAGLKVLKSEDPKILDAQLKFHALGAASFGIFLALSIYYA